jgi:predicted enzyme related to lactoylglutathione lyase
MKVRPANANACSDQPCMVKDTVIKGFATIWCQVSNMDASVEFYRDVLGLTLTIHSPYWSQFKVGDLNLGLHPKLEGEVSPLGIYGKGWFVGLETADLKALKERLLAAGATLHGGYHDVPGGTVLDFVDPDGNTLEAVQYGITAKDLDG